MPAYVAGRPPAPRAGRPSYKLSSNENPSPPLPSVLEVLARADRDINRYPDMFATGLVRRLAERHGVAPEQVVCGTGSVGVLGQVVQATCETGDEVVFAWRSFEAYPIVVGVSGAQAVRVPLTAQAGGRAVSHPDTLGPGAGRQSRCGSAAKQLRGSSW